MPSGKLSRSRSEPDTGQSIRDLERERDNAQLGLTTRFTQAHWSVLATLSSSRAVLATDTRSADCAWIYRNENEVGQGIKDSGIDRKDLWVTSKRESSPPKHQHAASQRVDS